MQAMILLSRGLRSLRSTLGRSAAIALGGLLWAGPAQAGDCPTPYTTDRLLGDLVNIEQFLRNGDDVAAGQASKGMEAGLGCLNEVLPPMIAGRAYRAVAAGLVVSGETERGEAWFRTAAEIEQSFDYGLEDLPEDHPVRDAYAAARQQASGEQVPVEGKAFAEGSHYLDGRKIDAPRARLDRPHVFQLDGDGVRSWVIEGNAFPGERLVDVAPVAVVAAKEAKVKEPKPPKEKKLKEPKPPKEKPEAVAKVKASKVRTPTSGVDGTVVLQRQRPWEKTPLMIGGGVIMVAGGGLYALALGQRNSFEAATTKTDVEKHAQQANQLVIASAAVIAAGTGTLTWGIILDGGTPLPTFRVRF